MTGAANSSLPAATVLRSVLAKLRDTTPFLVLRNYEDLPEDWNNDIDILVAPTDLERAHAVLVDTLQNVAGAAPVEVMRRINFRAARLFCADRVLHIDLYSAMSKGWAIYADTSAILAACRPMNPLFDVPAQLHEELLIAAKELFSYGEVRPRYHARLAGYDPRAARAAAERIFGTQMTESGLALVARALVDPTVKGRPSLRLSVLLHFSAAVIWARMRRNGWVVQIARDARYVS